jgi:hypothetical protein
MAYALWPMRYGLWLMADGKWLAANSKFANAKISENNLDKSFQISYHFC